MTNKTYTVIKKSGDKYKVTVDTRKRTTIRSGKGFSTGGAPATKVTSMYSLRELITTPPIKQYISLAVRQKV